MLLISVSSQFFPEHAGRFDGWAHTRPIRL